MLELSTQHWLSALPVVPDAAQRAPSRTLIALHDDWLPSDQWLSGHHPSPLATSAHVGMFHAAVP